MGGLVWSGDRPVLGDAAAGRPNDADRRIDDERAGVPDVPFRASVAPIAPHEDQQSRVLPQSGAELTPGHCFDHVSKGLLGNYGDPVVAGLARLAGQ